MDVVDAGGGYFGGDGDAVAVAVAAVDNDNDATLMIYTPCYFRGRQCRSPSQELPIVKLFQFHDKMFSLFSLIEVEIEIEIEIGMEV